MPLVNPLTPEEQNVVDNSLPALQNTGFGRLVQSIINLINTGGTTDAKVAADSSDSAPDTLDEKILAGTGLSQSVVVDGGKRKVKLDASGGTSSQARTMPVLEGFGSESFAVNQSVWTMSGSEKYCAFPAIFSGETLLKLFFQQTTYITWDGVSPLLLRLEVFAYDVLWNPIGSASAPYAIEVPAGASGIGYEFLAEIPASIIALNPVSLGFKWSAYSDESGKSVSHDPTITPPIGGLTTIYTPAP